MGKCKSYLIFIGILMVLIVIFLMIFILVFYCLKLRENFGLWCLFRKYERDVLC